MQGPKVRGLVSYNQRVQDRLTTYSLTRMYDAYVWYQLSSEDVNARKHHFPEHPELKIYVDMKQKEQIKALADTGELERFVVMSAGNKRNRGDAGTRTPIMSWLRPFDTVFVYLYAVDCLKNLQKNETEEAR